MCTMRADALNLDDYPVRTKMTGEKHTPISHVCYTEDSKSKEFLLDKTSSQVCSTSEDESKIIIVDECSTEESES